MNLVKQYSSPYKEAEAAIKGGGEMKSKIEYTAIVISLIGIAALFAYCVGMVLDTTIIF